MFYKYRLLLRATTCSFRRNCCTQEGIEYIKNLKPKIGFIGDGNMAKAICQSIISNGLVKPSQVYVSSPFQDNLKIWARWNTNVSTNNAMVAQESDVIFLAVKPYVLSKVAKDLEAQKESHKIANKLFISVLAGITIESLENIFLKYPDCRVVRTMLNTPLLVGEGCVVYCPGTNVTDKDLLVLQTLLGVSSICEEMPERMINVIGALAGGGPAFVYLMIEALSDGGVRMGLHRSISTKFAAQTVLGAAKMVLKTGKHTGELKDEICSAGGTTIAGIHALENKGVRGAFMDAIEDAVKRADEMGKEE